MFQVEHRIVVAHGGFQQALGIVGCRGNDDFDAWRMKEPRLGARRMKWPALGASTGGTTDHYWHRHPHAPVHLVGHVDDLVKATGDEVDELHLRNRTHAHQGCPDGGTDDGGLGHGCIDDAIRSELFQEARADFECSPVGSHVFTEQEDGLVAAHLLTYCLANCL